MIFIPKLGALISKAALSLPRVIFPDALGIQAAGSHCASNRLARKDLDQSKTKTKTFGERGTNCRGWVRGEGQVP